MDARFSPDGKLTAFDVTPSQRGFGDTVTVSGVSIAYVGPRMTFDPYWPGESTGQGPRFKPAPGAQITFIGGHTLQVQDDVDEIRAALRGAGDLSGYYAITRAIARERACATAAAPDQREASTSADGDTPEQPRPV